MSAPLSPAGPPPTMMQSYITSASASARPFPRTAGSRLSSLHDLLQPSQVVFHLRARLFSEQLGNRCPNFSGGRVIAQHDAHFGALAVGCEVHRTRVIDVG